MVKAVALLVRVLYMVVALFRKFCHGSNLISPCLSLNLCLIKDSFYLFLVNVYFVIHYVKALQIQQNGIKASAIPTIVI